MNYGFIYCLGNQAMPGIYKIGMTDRAPSQRCSELSGSTSAAMPFQLLCYTEVDNAMSVEREIHQELSSYRVNQSREFFTASYRHIHSIFMDYNGAVAETSEGAEEAEKHRLMLAYFDASGCHNKTVALLAAFKFAGVRIWRDGDMLQTSKNLPFNSWITGAAAGLRPHLLDLVPRKEPVSRLMQMIRNAPEKPLTEELDW